MEAGVEGVGGGEGGGGCEAEDAKSVALGLRDRVLERMMLGVKLT